MSPQESKSNFLSLPPEVRLRIYDYLLVCKSHVTPDYRPRRRQPITLSVLRTCKQIHTEASQIFYSKNEIQIDKPGPVIRWLKGIGQTNVKLLRKIRIFADVGHLWYKLLDALAREAVGLRHIYIYWCFNCSGAAGTDVHFVRTLGKFQRLQSMDLDGYYAIQWPSYLRGKLGIEVQEEQPSSRCLKMYYQQGTENLLP